MYGKYLKTRNVVVLILSIIFFFLAALSAQDNKVDETKKLREEILEVYKSGGKPALIDFFKKNRDKITNKFIVDFAKAGLKERKEEWLNTCKTMAEEKKDEKSMAYVYLKIGEYFRITWDNRAKDYYDKAIFIYLKLGDPIGEGNAYLGKGTMYFDKGNNSIALEMFNKSLPLFEKTGNLFGQGKVYLSKGNLYATISDNSRAIENYDKALAFFEKVGHLDALANVFRGKGIIYAQIGENPKALENFEKALFYFKKSGNIAGQNIIYFRKGIVYSNIGYNIKALEMFDKALPFFEKSGDFIGQGNILSKKGYIFFHMGKNPEAYTMYKKALPFLKKGGDLLGQGNVYLGQGLIHSNIGEDSRAIEMFDKARPFFKIIGDPIGQGNIYMGKGNVYLRIGGNSDAIEMFNEALTFFEKAGQPYGQGNVYLGKGKIYSDTGDNYRSLEMYKKAMPLFKKAKHLMGQGNVYLGRGVIYDRIGDNLKAIEMYDRALPFFKKVGDPINQGAVYLKKGVSYLKIGKNSQSLVMINKALPFFKKSEDPFEQGNVYLLKGAIYSSLGENSKAFEMYDKALPFYEKAKDLNGQGNVCLVKGDIYFRIENNLKALEMHNKTLHFCERSGDIELKSSALHRIAKVLEKLRKMDEAIGLFEEAVNILEKVRNQAGFPKMKRTFFQKVYEKYQVTALFMLENGYYKKGFQYAESMGARVFLDKMAEGLVSLEKGLKPELREQRDKMAGKLSALSKQMQETGAKDEKKLKELKEQYRKAENEFEELLIKIRLDNPLYASVKYPQPITVDELKKVVLKDNEVLVRYFNSPGKLYVFLISKKSFKVVPLNIKEKDLNSLAEQYLLALKENNYKRIERYGNKLYRELFLPLEDNLKRSRDIIIIPDGELAKIPFESFVVERNNGGKPLYLIERYRLKYIQSASVLSVLRKYYKREGENKSFIGFGDPVYDYENFSKGLPEQGSNIQSPKRGDEIWELHNSRYARDGGILNRLKGSGEAVTAIADLFKKHNQKSVINLREQATEETAKGASMKDFDFIHFACHGLLNDDFQSLVLSQLPPDKSKEDGYFTLNEIMNCDYNAKLVVLSACQTGSGKMERGEGVTGLTRAVMYAGTPAVVASLWDVDDHATKELMINFYRNMLEKNLNKVEALRQAKLELLKNKKYSSPLFWSAFVLYGE